MEAQDFGEYNTWMPYYVTVVTIYSWSTAYTRPVQVNTVDTMTCRKKAASASSAAFNSSVLSRLDELD